VSPARRMDALTPHVCRGCRLPLVQPERVEAERLRWRVYLRCPSCGWTAEELLDDAALRRLDDELERGTEQLVVAMREATDRNMREYAACFVSALAADAILPADF
jgi:hypothetical protein